MKKIGKILAAVMAIAILLSLSVPALAAPTGTITINNAIVGQEYTIYKMASLDSYDPVSGNYSYKVNDYWKAFFLSHDVNVDSTNHLEYTSTIINAPAFAKDAVAYAEAGVVGGQVAAAEVQSIVATSDTVTFTVDLGYYCIDSTLGAVCALTNADPDGTVVEKNGTPIIEKYVVEDSTGNPEHTNDDNLGATVSFQIEVTKVAGAVNYVVGDKLSAGLTWDGDIDEVHFGTDIGVLGTDYTLYANPGDPTAWEATLTTLVGAENVAAFMDYTFMVALNNETVDKMVDGAEILIYYTATINENAKIGNEGNPNEANLVFGNDPKSILTPVTTKTYVWPFQVFKYTNADSTKKPLADAQFSIYEINPEVDPSATAMWLKPLGEIGGVDYYRHVHNPSDTTGLVQVITTTANGKFVVEGLDSGTYWMKEVAAPAGYHMLRSLVEIRIGVVGNYSDASLQHSVANTVDGYIEVLNSTGVVLPETGGIGTIIFITTGTLLVLSMGVLLVVRKRMGNVIFTR